MANSGRIGEITFIDNLAANTMGTGLIGLDGGTLATNSAYGLVWVQSLDTGDTSYVISQSATLGQHIAGSGTGVNDNLKEFCSSDTMFYGQTGFNAVEIMVQFDAVTNMTFNFGFHDDVTESSSVIPVELSTATWASTASTFLGFVFDTQATNDELHCFWVDDDTDTVVALGDLRCKGMALTANKWLYMRVEMQDCGSGKPVRATFHAVHDGKSITKEFDTTVDRDAALCYYFGVVATSTTPRGIFIKAPGWTQTIAD